MTAVIKFLRRPGSGNAWGREASVIWSTFFEVPFGMSARQPFTDSNADGRSLVIRVDTMPSGRASAIA